MTRPAAGDAGRGTTARIHGIVLAGGRSRRMGRDKAGVLLGGRTLLARVCDRLAPQCLGLVVSRQFAEKDVDRGEFPVVADDAAAEGPLAGLLAGLDFVARSDPSASHAVSVAVDTPFLPRDLVVRLIEAQEAAGAAAACAESGGRRHPVAALWPVAARGALRAALTVERLRRVGAFLDRYAPAAAPWPTAPFDPFFNVNTPADLEAAEVILKHFGPM